MITVVVYGFYGPHKNQEEGEALLGVLHKRLKETGIEDPNKIIFNLAYGHVTNGSGGGTGYCDVIMTPTDDGGYLSVVMEILRHEGFSGDRVRFFTSKLIPHPNPIKKS